jgi:hypothetical protein
MAGRGAATQHQCTSFQLTTRRQHSRDLVSLVVMVVVPVREELSSSWSQWFLSDNGSLYHWIPSYLADEAEILPWGYMLL